jgi:glycosyltransferase involved in cell wall biosynthesis
MAKKLHECQDLKLFIHSGHIPFSEYIILVNRTKILASSSVTASIGGKMMKWSLGRPEAMACKALCLSDKSDMIEKYHFISNYNFVDVDENNFLEKSKYYLQNEEERKRIIENAYQTIMTYHSAKVRARELIKIMEELIKK